MFLLNMIKVQQIGQLFSFTFRCLHFDVDANIQCMCPPSKLESNTTITTIILWCPQLSTDPLQHDKIKSINAGEIGPVPAFVYKCAKHNNLNIHMFITVYVIIHIQT